MPELDNSVIESSTAGLGEGDSAAYVAQTFIAQGYGMHRIKYFMDADGPGASKYHVLITEVIENETGFHPGRVLKEVTGQVENADPVGTLSPVEIDLSGLRLEKGKTYAIVFDTHIVADGVADIAGFGFNDNYLDGSFYFNSSSAGRATDFAAPWDQPGEFPDLAFSATFSDEGETVTGTKKDDKLKGTVDDDMIDGKKGDDVLKAKAGFDTLIGGKGKDVLKGGNDGDVLIGGKNKDKLYGQEGYDCYVFDFKMTKKSAKKHQDKIYGFETDKDEIHLKQKHFSDLALGELPEDDTMITYKKKALFYDGVKFVKFKDGAPSSLDDIDIVVVA